MKSSNKQNKIFIKPTEKEVYEYMVEKEFELAKSESHKFINFYESRYWYIGKTTKMRDWKSAVSNWILHFYERNKIQTTKKTKLEVIQESHESNDKI